MGWSHGRSVLERNVYHDCEKSEVENCGSGRGFGGGEEYQLWKFKVVGVVMGYLRYTNM